MNRPTPAPASITVRTRRIRSRVVTVTLPVLLAGAVGGCRKIDEAPATLSDVLRGLWVGWDDASADEYGALAFDITTVLDEDAIGKKDGWLKGNQAPLDADAQAAVELYAPPDDEGTWTLPDPAAAQPMYLAKRYTCGVEALEEILIALDQKALYGDDEYDRYERTYDSSLEDYRSGASDRLSWTSDLDKTVPTYPAYTETLRGGIRRVPVPTDLESPPPWTGEDMLVTRTWIPYPAHVLDPDKADAFHFDQDYQIEAFVPWEGGDVVHLYGIWRELDGWAGDLSNEGVQQIMFNALAKWDDDTEALCAAGLP